MIEFVIIGILVVLVFVLIFYMSRTTHAINDLKNNPTLNLMQQQLQGTTQQISDRLDKAAETIRDVAVATQRVYDMEKDIASLQDLLKPPKFRGELGEFFLENLLAQILPRSYYIPQYVFKSGAKVDAVISLRNRMVPVDSKFPLEDFERIIKSSTDEEHKVCRKRFVISVKKHIDDIASKYILPDEGTYDFALMYIPAENVYYETIIKDTESKEGSIFSYSLSKKVIPVSPNSFYAYLQVIVEGLKGFHIEKRVGEVIQLLSRLQGDFTRFKEDFNTAGRHLINAKNKFDEAERKLLQLEDKLISVSELPVKELTQDEP